MKKLILKLLLKWYVNRNREIIRLSNEEWYEKYLFKNQKGIYDILRAELSAETVRYFEAKSDTERNIVKGGALKLKSILDRHRKAIGLENNNNINKDNKIKIFNK